MMTMLHIAGLLHSDILGSILACRSPRLFAAYRVLHRLLMPRHPPCALISLNASLQNYVLFSNNCFFLAILRRSLKLYFTQILKVLPLNWIFLHFLFVVSLFNFQRSSQASFSRSALLRHLKSSKHIWWRLRESNP